MMLLVLWLWLVVMLLMMLLGWWWWLLMMFDRSRDLLHWDLLWLRAPWDLRLLHALAHEHDCSLDSLWAAQNSDNALVRGSGFRIRDPNYTT
jgi:hypothetical protein